VEETHVSLGRRPTVLEAGESRTWFPFEKRVSLERSNSCQSVISRWK
jgi:hypothetical protein